MKFGLQLPVLKWIGGVGQVMPEPGSGHLLRLQQAVGSVAEGGDGGSYVVVSELDQL